MAIVIGSTGLVGGCLVRQRLIGQRVARAMRAAAKASGTVV